jgi:trans-aconitate methyltransferase
MFGPYERQISEAYRSIYIDIDAFVELMRQWKPNASRILEVGCGEGAVTQRLNAAYPNAKITASGGIAPGMMPPLKRLPTTSLNPRRNRPTNPSRLVKS